MKTVIRRVLALLPVLCFPAAALAEAGAEPASSLEFHGRSVFNMHFDTALQRAEFSSYLLDDRTHSLNFNPRDTRLGFTARTEDGDWKLRGVFEMDFYGSNAGSNLLPRLRLGFAEAANGSLSLRGGQDWIPVAQQMPGCIDFGVLSWSGNLWARVPQFTVRGKQGRIEWLASVMKNRVATAQEQQEVMPWLLARVALPDLSGSGSLLALGGGYRSVDIDSSSYAPWLVALEFRQPVGELPLLLNGEVYAADGIGNEFVHNGLDYNPAHADGATAIGTVGGFVNLEWKTGEKTRIHLGYGFDDPEDGDLEGLATAAYLQNSVAYACLKVNLTKHLGWGLETLHYRTDTGAADPLQGERLTTSWWYQF